MAKKKRTKARRCGVCKHIKYGKVNQETGEQEDSICTLFHHYLSHDDVLWGVDCNSFERIPYTCASCGADIVKGCRKANIISPFRYRSGKHKGKVKPCCDTPDWRYCPNRDCEAIDAIICKNCGAYYGEITW